ncbi:pyridoxal phosphate-dependent aminotransferase [Metaclostridioides mangenotii]|uniref:pyridoxal phosphate-dependent aminotransferase n=1 Tax=Metaclostridioides mangenotii TaxID=1540 RepID=UPI0028E9E60D|nr:aminotransferase class I/II-fold pyridoxal phosphate-dependent enzyme [Clostridioides mangenotii]
MKDLGHGADINSLAKLYNKDPRKIIDFSSNINPNIIKDLEKHVYEGFKLCKSYPDIDYQNLRNNISDYLDVDSKYIIPGNGATEIIYLLMKSIGRRLAVLNPTFSEYGRSAYLNGLDVMDLYLDKDKGFRADINQVVENLDRFDSLFICNPNNPSGNVQDISKLMDILHKNNKLLIVDETFMEFVGDEQDYSLLKYVENNKNLFIIKAATKFFGLPGLRLGYGITSNNEILERIYKFKEPWTINSIADHLSNYIFSDKGYIQQSKLDGRLEREFLLERLKGIENIEVYDSDTNFILIKLINKRSFQVKVEMFKDHSILIRDASNFKGLDDSFIRIAVKSREDNLRVIKSLERVVG